MYYVLVHFTCNCICSASLILDIELNKFEAPIALIFSFSTFFANDSIIVKNPSTIRWKLFVPDEIEKFILVTFIGIYYLRSTTGRFELGRPNCDR